jgi:hypothetical protein
MSMYHRHTTMTMADFPPETHGESSSDSEYQHALEV